MAEPPGTDEAEKNLSLGKRDGVSGAFRFVNGEGHPLAAGQRHLESTNPLINKHSREAALWEQGNPALPM